MLWHVVVVMRARTITLRPKGSRLKVVCHVYPNKRAMHSAIRRSDGISNEVLAFTETRIAAVPEGTAAVIFLSKTHLTAGIVAHEFDHACFAILARRRVHSIPCDTEKSHTVEEDHAYLLQRLTNEFYKKL